MSFNLSCNEPTLTIKKSIALIIYGRTVSKL